MSESIQIFRDMKVLRKLLRQHHGQPCPRCVQFLPKAHPTILLPQERCRIHRYTDPRPELTQADYDALPQPPEQP